jgi:hypothetical protein
MNDVKLELENMMSSASACSKNLSSHELIHSINTASRNLNTTLTRINSFQSIPARVARLEDALVSIPSALGLVYTEASDLEQWRDDLIEEVKGGVSGASSNNGNNGNNAAGYTHSPEVYAKIVDVLGGHFAVVFSLSQNIRTHVKKLLCDCFALSEDNPALLVKACEVMVQIQLRNAKKAESMSPEEASILGDVTRQFTDDCIKDIEAAFDNRILKSYSSYMYQAADEGKTGIEATLRAATMGMVDMSILKDSVAPCFPPPDIINVLRIYRQRFELHVTPQVAALYSQNMSGLDNADLLRMVSWLHQYNAQIASNEEGAKIEQFEDAVEDLITQYTLQMARQTEEWLLTIEERDSELIKDAERHFVTRNPEDMLTLVNALISVARDQLPAELACRAILAIVQEMKAAQQRQTVALEEGWKDMDVEKICAAVNDAFRMQDKCEELIDEVVDVKDQSEELCTAMDDLCTGYVELAVSASKLCAKSVLLDVEPYLVDVFTAKWEDGEELVSVATKTLQDWFQDLAVWLPEYFFSKLVRECYERVVKTYVEAMFKNRKKSFAEPSRAAQHLVNDRINLFELFGGQYSYNLMAAGLREEGVVEKQLSVLTNVSKVLLAPYVYNVKDEITGLLEEFGAQGKDAVYAVIVMRKGNTKESLKEWKGVVGTLFTAIGSKGEVVQHKYELPFKTLAKAAAAEDGAGGSPRIVGGEGGGGTGGFALGGSNPFGSNPFGSSNGEGGGFDNMIKAMKTQMGTPAKKK